MKSLLRIRLEVTLFRLCDDISWWLLDPALLQKNLEKPNSETFEKGSLFQKQNHVTEDICSTNEGA